MIVGEQKPLAEIHSGVKHYSRLLILGCGTCVKTCFAGGEDEVATLASSLRLIFKKDRQEIKIDELTIERQCEDEFIKEAADKISHSQAVLSLACGAGVQMIASRFKKNPVIPGVNTTFIGVLEKQGLFHLRPIPLAGRCEPLRALAVPDSVPRWRSAPRSPAGSAYPLPWACCPATR